MTIQLRCVLCDELYAASEDHVCRKAVRAPVSERRELARKALETISLPSESEIAEVVDPQAVDTSSSTAPEPLSGAAAWERHKAYRREYMKRYRARKAGGGE